ncbi:hypothetical protein LWI29_035922 [Acer saccharum]|uniref:Uncharacterized protein n=1 Tax=Acer saccharum TaxID=4024 RepID=A0AA39S1Q8_ACESA|nr:hypothetical protein LWI29_035922 [Acer saccharum]
MFPAECLNIADLGCFTGPNTLLVVSQIMDIVDAACRNSNHQPPSFQSVLKRSSWKRLQQHFQVIILSGFYKNLEEEKGCKFRPNCFIAGYTWLFLRFDV